MQIWPENVPYAVVRDGYDEKPLYKPLGTEMEDGPLRMRRTGNIDARVETVGIILRTDLQVNLLRRFFEVTLNQASDEFTMPVKLLGESGYTTRECQVQNGEYRFAPFAAAVRLSFTRIVYL